MFLANTVLKEHLVLNFMFYIIESYKGVAWIVLIVQSLYYRVCITEFVLQSVYQINIEIVDLW